MPLDPRLSYYEQELKVIGDDDVYQPVEYAGDVDPVLVRANNRFIVVVQSGKAIGWRSVFVPPAIYSGGTLLEPPEISIKRLGTVKWETTWHYVLACTVKPTRAEQITHSKYPTTIVMENVA